tara:strand:- start:1976 stop:2389 length:414 start_codon:yes stop_codon:yes gene_type:complete
MLRKIDLEMNKAVRNRVPLLKDNTEVKVSGSRFTASVYLFGNDIARIVGPWIIFSKLCVEEDEWKTATTKRRINALLHEFVPSLGLYQFKNKWYFSRSFSYDLLWESDNVSIHLDEKFISINYIRYPFTTQLSGEVA